MPMSLFHTQLKTQLSQWIKPKDKRHLNCFAENVAAIVQAQSACLSRWLTYLSHRDCRARSHLERLSYFVHNSKITAETCHGPLVSQFLKAWEGASMTDFERHILKLQCFSLTTTFLGGIAKTFFP